MIRSLLPAALMALVAFPALAQPAVDRAFEACAAPDRWLDEIMEDLERDGWGILVASEVSEVARLVAAMDVIDRAQREGWSAELSASDVRAEAEVQAWASYLEEGLRARVRNGIPFAIPPSEYATLLAPGGGVLDIEVSPEFRSAHCVLKGIWKGSSEVVIGGERLSLNDGGRSGDATRPGTFQARLERPGVQGEIYARFYDLETMTQSVSPEAGQAFVLVVSATAP